MHILTSNCVLLLILAASSFTDDLKMRILGHIPGGCIDSIGVDKLVSVLLLCANE